MFDHIKKEMKRKVQYRLHPYKILQIQSKWDAGRGPVITYLPRKVQIISRKELKNIANENLPSKDARDLRTSV